MSFISHEVVYRKIMSSSEESQRARGFRSFMALGRLAGWEFLAALAGYKKAGKAEMRGRERAALSTSR